MYYVNLVNLRYGFLVSFVDFSSRLAHAFFSDSLEDPSGYMYSASSTSHLWCLSLMPSLLCGFYLWKDFFYSSLRWSDKELLLFDNWFSFQFVKRFIGSLHQVCIYLVVHNHPWAFKSHFILLLIPLLFDRRLNLTFVEINYFVFVYSYSFIHMLSFIRRHSSIRTQSFIRK